MVKWESNAHTFMTLPGYQLVVYSFRFTLTLCDMDSTSYTAYDNVWFSQSIMHSVSRMDTTTLLYTLMISGSIYEKQNHTWPNYNHYIKFDASSWLGSLHLITLGSISLVRRVENKGGTYPLWYDTRDDLKGRTTVKDGHNHYDDDSSDILNVQFR